MDLMSTDFFSPNRFFLCITKDINIMVDLDSTSSTISLKLCPKSNCSKLCTVHCVSIVEFASLVGFRHNEMAFIYSTSCSFLEHLIPVTEVQ